jgi:phosphoglycolate phosphatase
MNDYQLVIFDWEGTLSDPLGLSLTQLSKLSVEAGLGPLDEARARRYQDLNFHDFMHTLYDESLPSHVILALKGKLRQYQYLHSDSVQLFRGVKSLLKSLHEKGALLAIATGKSRQGLRSDLLKMDISEYFFTTRSPCDCSPKPAPDMLEEIMGMADVDKNNAVMVGDSLCDLEAANHAGVDCIMIDVDKRYEEKALLADGAKIVVKTHLALTKQLLD